MAPRIRIAGPRSIPIIRGIAIATWPVAYGTILSPAQIAYMLERMYSEGALAEQMGSGQTFLLAYVDERAVGFASCETGHREDLVTRIHKLYVLPDQQGHGIGAALLGEIRSSAIHAGDHSLELNVNRNNKAKDFYVKHGFHVVRDEVIDIGNGFVMDDHVMALSLA